MEKGTLLFGILATIAILGLVAVAVAKVSAPINIQPAPERNTLTVTGTKEFSVAPDEAELVVQIVSGAPSAKTASELSKDRLAAVRTALQNKGVAATEIQTTGVVLTKRTEWDKKLETTIDRGYEQTTTLRITVAELDRVGEVLDAAIAAGANNVQEVRFTLRPETEARYKQEALRDATTIARQKATLMAETAGAQLGDVTSINENSYVMPWTANSVAFAGNVRDADAAALGPERVSLSVSVSVTYGLE